MRFAMTPQLIFANINLAIPKNSVAENGQVDVFVRIVFRFMYETASFSQTGISNFFSAASFIAAIDARLIALPYPHQVVLRNTEQPYNL